MKKFLLSILCLVAMAVTGYAAEATFVFSDHYGSATLSDISDNPMTVDGITMTFAKGNSNNNPAFNKALEIRLYGGTSASVLDGNTVTVTAPAGTVITGVVFKPGTNGTWGVLTADNGNISTAADHTSSWYGNAETIVFTANRDANNASAATQNRYSSAVVTYESAIATSVATPTFTVEAGTYATKQNVGIECADEDATIYYTLDGTTPDKTSTLYEGTIALFKKTTVKAIAYVGEDASNVASATYDFKLDQVLTWNENSPAIQANTSSCKTNFVSPWGTSGAYYYRTFDGSEPSAENPNAAKVYPSATFMMYTGAKDTVVTVKVRPQSKDSIYGETIERTFYFHYAAQLPAYKAAKTMTAGNYVILGENTMTLPIDGGKNTYGYGYTIDATVNNGMVNAYSYFEFAFEATDGGYYIKDSKGQYLYSKGTYKSFQLSTTVPTSGGVWSVEIQDNGQAKITNNETGLWMQWDSYYKNWALYNSDQGTFMPTLAAEYKVTVTMTPKAGDTVEKIDKITFYCADGIVAATNIKYVTLMTDKATITGTANQIDENTIEYVLSETITAVGDYELRLYQKAFTLAPNSLAQAWPTTMEMVPIKVDNPFSIKITPDGKESVETLQHFTFANELGLTINPNYEGQAPFLGYTNMTTGESSMIELTAGMATETSITLSTAEVITAENYYTLVVGAGYFIVGDEKESDAMQVQYNLSVPVKVVSTTPKAGETVASFSEMTIEFNKAISIDDWYADAYVSDADGKSVGTLKYEMIDPKQADYYTISNKVRFYLETALTEKGVYNVNIPAYYIMDVSNYTYMESANFEITVGEVSEEVDYIFNANDYQAEDEFTTLTDGIFTFLQGEGSTKTWIIDENSKTFSNGHKATHRIKPQTDKNYITAEVPEAGKLVFGVLTSSSSDATRTLSVKQNDVELYGKVVSEADKVDGVYNVHEVAVEKGTATITMAGSLNFYYIEFVAGGGETPEAETIQFLSVKPEEGVVTSLKEIQIITDTDLGEIRSLTLTDAEGNSYEISAVANDREGEDGIYESIIATIKDEITAAGTYTLTLPAGSVVEYITDMETQTSKLNAEKTFTWTIEEAAPAITATWNIEEGATIESFESATITFAGAGIESAKAKNTYGNFIFYEKDAEGNYNLTEAGGASAGYMDTEANGTAVTFSIDLWNYSNGIDPLRRKGDYRIVIPAGSIKFNNDNANLNTEEYVLNFTIDNDFVEPTEIEAAFTADPENNTKVSEIREIVLTFTEYTEVTVAEADFVSGSNIPQAFMKDPDFGMQMPAGYMMARPGTAANQVVIYVDPTYTGGLEAFNVPADYIIMIPAGVVKFGNDINKEFQLNYTVGQTVEPLAIVSTNPEANEEVESFSEMIIEFNKPVWYNVGVSGKASLKDGEGFPVTDLEVEMIDPVGNHTTWNGSSPLSTKVRLYVATPITEAKKYQVVLPAEAFSTDDMSETTVKTTIKFSVVAPALAIVSTTPAEGQEVESFSEMIVEYNMPVWYTNLGSVKLVDGEGTTVSTLSTEMIDPVGNHSTWSGSTPLAYKVRMYTTTPVTTDGSYSVVIANETFALDDASQYTAKTTINFTVKAAAQEGLAVIASTPAENSVVTEKLESILTTWNKNVDLTFDSSAQCYIEDAEGNKVTDAIGNWVFENGICLDNQIEFVLSKPIENANGIYTLVIGAGYIYDMATGDENEEIRISFELNINTGIKGITADAVYGYVVYDFNGVLVMQTKNAADLERLNNGLYIINGVKVLINK